MVPSLMLVIQKMAADRMAGRRSIFHPGIILWILSGAFLAIALVFTFYAGFVWLGAFFPAAMAAFITAMAGYMLALGAAIIGNVIAAARSRKVSDLDTTDIMKVVDQIVTSLSDELEEPIRENPKTALILAGLAGYIAGDQRI